MACGTVQAHVDYLKRLPLYQTEKPFQLFIPIEEGATDQRPSNLEFESRQCTFHDVRNELSSCQLDSEGFEVLRHPTQMDPMSFEQRELVESQYLEEVKDILQKVDGGYDKIFIFDWRVSLQAQDTKVPKDSWQTKPTHPDLTMEHAASRCQQTSGWARVRHERLDNLAAPLAYRACWYVYRWWHGPGTVR